MGQEGPGTSLSSGAATIQPCPASPGHACVLLLQDRSCWALTTQFYPLVPPALPQISPAAPQKLGLRASHSHGAELPGLASLAQPECRKGPV